MNKKAIKAVLASKLQVWAASIEDEHVKSLVLQNTIITGGAITSMLLNEEVKDYDVYFTNKETTLAVAQYYVAKFKETHPKEELTVKEEDDGRIKIVVPSKGVSGEAPTEAPFEDVYDVLPEESKTEKLPTKFKPVFLSSNAITLSDKIQVVIRFYGNVEEIHKNYDFVHCTNAWSSQKGELILRQEALEAILAKELRYCGSKYPLCSIIRTRKFIKRGWSINAGQYLKMIMQCNELNLKDPKVLEDQLIGVDSAYFNMIIEAVKSKQESDPTWTLDSSYLAAIIDKIF